MMDSASNLLSNAQNPQSAISALNDPVNLTPSWIKGVIEANTKLVVESITKQIDQRLNPVLNSLSEMQNKLDLNNKQSMSALEMAQNVSDKFDKQCKLIDELKAENEALKKDLRANNEKLTALNNYSRRSNLIFDGITEQPDETSSALLDKIHQVFGKMNISNYKCIKLERYHRLGHKAGKSNRPVIIRFSFFQDRELIWSNKKNLKGSQIYLREDFCKETLEYRQSLFPIIKAAKSDGKRCVVVGDTLIIDGKRYPRGALHNLPENLNLRNLSSKQDESSLAFYGVNHPLSNFYPCQFSVEGETFNCVEQFYQSHKARFFKDDITASEIMQTKDPAMQKRLSRSIRDYCEETWEPAAKDCLYNGILAKFSQNIDLRKFLIDTGDLVLLEASPRDQYWGTGCSLSSPNTLIVSSHPGQNYAGHILMSVRSQLSNVN